MSRYIDADELLELYDIDLDGLETDKQWTIPLEVVKQNIKDMPTVDVTKVVRCKDCIHNGSIDTDCPFGWKDKKFNMPKPNDFCSYGER